MGKAQASRRWSAGVIGLIVLSAASLVAAPMLMPESYSIVRHTVSESAAQGIDGAWLARSGLILFGIAVLILSTIAGDAWGLAGRVLFRVYGAGLMGTAAFSHKPWEPVVFDVFEDTVHSWASGVVGFSFIVGVVSVGLLRAPKSVPAHGFDIVAVVASAGISYFVFATPDIAGAIQRLMFVIAFVWFGLEAVRIGRPGRSSESRGPSQPVKADDPS